MNQLSNVVVGIAVGLVCSASCGTGPDGTLVEPTPPAPWGVPITGGTMIVTRDGNRAVIADPDRDRVVVLDLVSGGVADVVELAAGSEPGRVIEDGAGRIHVALRGSGELLTITGADRQLRPICGEPRGLAWEAELVHVACGTGELVSVPAGGGEAVRVVMLERDLRDVIVRASGLAVTTFRTATLIELDANGAVTKRVQPPIVPRTERESGGGGIDAVGDIHDAVASVAWRTVALADGRILMSHQRRVGTTLKLLPGGYGGGCGGGPVESSLTVIGNDDVPFAVSPATRGALPVDVAVNPVSGDLAVVTAGNQLVWMIPATSLALPDQDDCSNMVSQPLFPGDLGVDGLGAPTSVAYRPDGSLLALFPEAAVVWIRHPDGVMSTLSLTGTPSHDPGRTLFHREAPVGIACASCHPEARDDGGVWTFETLGVRRTQNLAGGILSRAPYHWTGDMPTLHALLEDVLAVRMGAGEVVPEEDDALGAWLDLVPAPRGVIRDSAAVQRGAALFNARDTGCTTCHSGPLYTNNLLANVGTNGVVKVPSLVGVGGRAPYLHDGCAATLVDRFGVCGGSDYHGHTSQLGAADLADLVAFLESL